jgi:hypothetical protein
MNSTTPEGGGAGGGRPGGRPTLDQMLWMGIGTNPAKMLVRTSCVSSPSMTTTDMECLVMVHDRFGSGHDLSRKGSLGHCQIL